MIFNRIEWSFLIKFPNNTLFTKFQFMLYVFNYIYLFYLLIDNYPLYIRLGVYTFCKLIKFLFIFYFNISINTILVSSTSSYDIRLNYCLHFIYYCVANDMKNNICVNVSFTTLWAFLWIYLRFKVEAVNSCAIKFN